MTPKRAFALAAAAAFSSLIVAGCGAQREPEDAATDDPIPTADVELPRDVEQIRVRVDALYESWHGTTEDRQAADVVLAYELNGAFDECVEDAGYDQDWRATINTAVEWPALQPTRWLRDPMRLWSAPQLLSYADVSGDEDSDVADPKQHDAIDRCREENPSVSRPADLLFPPPLDALEAQWTKEITAAVWPITGNEDDYVACVSETAEVLRAA